MSVFIKDHDGSHSCSASRYAAGHGGQAWLGRRQHLLRSLGGVPGPETHRHCPGRWRGVVGLKPGPDGQRRRKKVSGKNKTEVRAKLAELHDEQNDGVVTNAAYTVAQAIKDWLADGLAGRAPKTVSTQREVLEPLIDIIGVVPLRELSAPAVRSALKDLAATRATRTVGMTHAGLTRAIRHAEANDKVRRNVGTLVDTPVGQEGRPSKSSGRWGRRYGCGVDDDDGTRPAARLRRTLGAWTASVRKPTCGCWPRLNYAA